MITGVSWRQGTLAERPQATGSRLGYIATDTRQFFVEAIVAGTPTWLTLGPDLSAYQAVAAKGVADGYAALGSDGKVPTLQLPSLLGGGSDWDVTVVKALDEGRSANVTETDDATLKVPVLAGGVYMIEAYVSYTAANATSDFKFRLRVTAGNMLGFWGYVGSDTAANTLLARANLRLGSVANTTTIAAGTNAALGDIATVFIEAQVRCSAAGFLALQWAQNASNVSPTIVKALSLIRSRRIG